MGSGVHSLGAVVFMRCGAILVSILILVACQASVEKKKRTKVRRIPCAATQFPNTDQALLNLLLYIDYCRYRHEAHHLEQALP